MDKQLCPIDRQRQIVSTANSAPQCFQHKMSLKEALGKLRIEDQRAAGREKREEIYGWVS